jgi:hypothetical protein
MRRRARGVVFPPEMLTMAQASVVGEGFMGVNFLEDFGNVGNRGERIKFPGVLGTLAPEAIPNHTFGSYGYRFPARGRGWWNEPCRHSLAARGIPTSLPTDYPIYDSSILRMIEMDRWDLSVERGKDRHTINIVPELIPGVEWVEGGISDDRMAVDLTISRLERDDRGYLYPRLTPDSGYHAEIPAEEDGNLYRGMSWEEFQFVLRNGFIRSDGDYNIGDEEVGCTFFTEYPDTAAIYAGGFQPYYMVPTFNRPGYVVKVRRSPNLNIKALERGGDDVAVLGEIGVENIMEVYEARPYAIRPGHTELYRRYSPGRGEIYVEGSRFGPRVNIGYRRITQEVLG